MTRFFQGGNRRARLTIELVPATAWHQNIRTTVTEEIWDAARRLVYRQAGYRCEICQGKGSKHPVECHEIWHYNEATQVQKLVRLIALCPSCHLVKHFGRAQMVGQEDEACAHLKKVNGWDDARLDRYLEMVAETYNRRSTIQWTLDLTAMEGYTA